MGMFDYLRCKYPLPVEGADRLDYQTKDFLNTMDTIEIDEEGKVWGEEYDIEDQSDPNAPTPLGRLAGMMTRVNPKKVWLADFSGPINFYTSYGDRSAGGRDGWLGFQATVLAGMVQGVELVAHRPAAGLLAEALGAEDALRSAHFRAEMDKAMTAAGYPVPPASPRPRKPKPRKSKSAKNRKSIKGDAP